MVLEINNLTRFKIDKKSFSQVAKKVLSGENKGIPTKSRTRDADFIEHSRQSRNKIGAETMLSLAFVNKSEIKKLNKKYRGIDKPTDVLSFDLSSKIKNQKSKIQFKNQSYLGEIVICPEVVKPDKSQRHFDGPAIISAKRNLGGEEFARVFIHGILHLLGYEHEKSASQRNLMESREKKYLKFLNF